MSDETFVTITYRSNAMYSEADVSAVKAEVIPVISDMDGDIVGDSFEMKVQTKDEIKAEKFKELADFLTESEVTATLEITPPGSKDSFSVNLVIEED